MKIRYEIRSCVRDQFAAVAQIVGEDQEVTINGLVIEGVSEDGSMGHTFRCRGTHEELDAAFDRAQLGGVLVVTLAVEDPSSEQAVLLTAPAKRAKPAEPPATEGAGQ